VLWTRYHVDVEARVLTNDAPKLAPFSRPREPVSNEVAQVLLSHLVSGEYQPGQRLPPERALADALGVGRSLIREALKALTLLGLIEVRPGDGTYLRRRPSNLLPASFEWGLLLGENQLEDVMEARRELEVVLAGLAAQRRDDTDVAELLELLDKMRDATNAEDFVAADVAFHLRVAHAAKNSVLQSMLSGTQSLLHAWISRVIAAADETTPSYQEHVPVFEAIKAGDEAAARQAIRRHLELAGARLNDTLADYAGLRPR
jgi:GntR family transcriptional regulator, transcriptional repressor for pyruvate dehydrogenase complex